MLWWELTQNLKVMTASDVSAELLTGADTLLLGLEEVYVGLGRGGVAVSRTAEVWGNVLAR